MIYQVRANLFLSDIHIPDQIKQAILLIWHHAQVINPCSPNQECSFVDVIENHHDEHPTNPCTLIFHKDNCPVCP